jgi:hypothetical protein
VGRARDLQGPDAAHGFASIHFDLADQANSATTGHAQGQPLTQEQRDEIVAFEMQVFTAQQFDLRAGMLDAAGAKGGPAPLITQEYYFGINDPLGGDPEGFDPVAMTAFRAWEGARGRGPAEARASIARGEVIFNTHPISITGVSGLNDDLNLPAIAGTCTTCHDTPNSGTTRCRCRCGSAPPRSIRWAVSTCPDSRSTRSAT